MSNINYENIERYLAGELVGEELEAFEKELKNNEELKSELILYNTIENDFILTHKIKDGKVELAKTLELLNKQHFTQSSAKLVSIKRKWLFAAASIAAILLLILLILPNRELSHQELFADNINKNIEPLSLIQRGENDSLLTKASTLYNGKDYKSVIPLLIKATLIDSSSTQLQMALAFSYLQTKKSNLAINIFTKVSKGNTVYTDKAKWYIALIYLKENKQKECISILKQIPNSYDEYKNVSILLEKLEN